MSEISSSSASFVPLTDSDAPAIPASPAEPSLFHSACGTRRRAARCTAVVVFVLAVAGVAFYFNYGTRPARPSVDPLCDEWVQQYHLTPDAVSYCPRTASMQLLYNHSAVPFAAHLTTGTPLTRRPPTVALPSMERNHSYAFALLDVDFPAPDNTTLRAATHYLVVNIPGDNTTSLLPIERGTTLAPYRRPCPPPLPGWHRYVALVYDQGATHNASQAARNISGVPPVMMDIGKFLSVLVGFDISQSLVGGTFFYGQYESLFCNLG